jgi:hypothetical protein
MKRSWIPRRTRPDTAEPVGDDDHVLALIESYLSWCEQCAAVQSAYERWNSGGEERGLAFAIYRAELEFEEHAARAYRQLAERLAPRPCVQEPITC